MAYYNNNKGAGIQMSEHRIMANMLLSDKRTDDGSIVLFIILPNGHLRPVLSFSDETLLEIFVKELSRVCGFFINPVENRTMDWSKIDELKKNYSAKQQRN